MQRIVGGIGYVAAGAVVGAFSAYLVVVNTGTEPATAGSPWLSRAAGLEGASGFYVRSHYMIEGRLPPAMGQLVEAMAETDEEGEPLTTSCHYRLASTGSLPRWWSVAAINANGSGGVAQSIIDADIVIKETDGTSTIVVSKSPQPGNWIIAPRSQRFALLYSALPSRSRNATAPPFSITREDCP
jgi:hypothetical protein